MTEAEKELIVGIVDELADAVATLALSGSAVFGTRDAQLVMKQAATAKERVARLLDMHETDGA